MCTKGFEGQKLLVVIVVVVKRDLKSNKENLRVAEIVFKILKTKGLSEAQESQEPKVD